jgi:ribose transport system substrate-binding protein
MRISSFTNTSRRRRMRLLAQAVSVVAVGGLLTSCANSTSHGAGGTQAADGHGAAAGKHFIYIENSQQEAAAAIPIVCGMTTVAKAHDDTVSMVYPTAFTAAAQIPDLQAAAAQRPAGILIGPASPTGMQSAINSVISSGIPVVTVEQQIANSSKVTSQVIDNDAEGGVLAAKYLAQRAGGKKVEIALLTYTAGASTVTDAEWAAFDQAIKQYPNITEVPVQFGQYNVSSYVSLTSALLTRYPNLFGVFGDWGDAAMGAISAIKQQHANTLVVSTYALAYPALVADLGNGSLAAIVDWNTGELGTYGMTEMVGALNGAKVPHLVQVAPEVYTKANFAAAEAVAKEAC